MDRAFLRGDPREVAPELLGAHLVHDLPGGVRRGRIVEVEAYCGPEDPAAHTYRGRTERNASMFDDGGTLYVYSSYGLHWCANVVCGPVGEGVAVLVRALAPIEGVDAMFGDRGPAARRLRDLCSGPGKLTQAMGIVGAHDGTDLLGGGPLRIEAGDPVDRIGGVVQTTRVGITKATEAPWRWYVAEDPNVSRR